MNRGEGDDIGCAQGRDSRGNVVVVVRWLWLLLLLLLLCARNVMMDGGRRGEQTVARETRHARVAEVRDGRP